MQQLIELCTKPYDSNSWSEESEKALLALFGSDGERYSIYSQKEIQLRTPTVNVPFSAIIRESNPSSGGYSGMSTEEGHYNFAGG